MNIKDGLYAETILATPHFRHLCMVDGGDQGAGVSGGAGAGGVAEGGDDAQDPAADGLQDSGDDALDLSEEAPPAGEGEESDEAELEIGPDKVKVPKAVKAAFDGLQKDVWNKTEAAKKETAAAGVERERAQTFARHVQAITEEVTEIRSIDKQLEPFKDLTPMQWMQWAQKEPEAAGQAQVMITALQNRRIQLAQSAEGKVKGIQEQDAKAITERTAAADKEIATQIKDWPQKKDAIVKLVKDAGYDERYVQAMLMDARAVGIVHDAMRYRAAVAKAAAKTQPAAKETEAPQQPAPKVRSTGSSNRNDLSDRVPIDQWQNNFQKLMAS